MDEKGKFYHGGDDKFAADSSWTLRGGGGGSEDGAYFFGDGVDGDESSILRDFGWIFPPPEDDAAGEDGGFDLIKSDLAGSDITSAATPSGDGEPAAAAEKAEPASSSSSEDQPEKPSASRPPPADTTSKMKKKVAKRMKQPRFAFMTKSEVDHLEDGYRWRKYGQKAVKHSPFPRSYYRCTNTKCTVKKRVERSSEDPTVVVTTYEGQHCHHTVGFRGSGFMMGHEASPSMTRGLNPLGALQSYLPAGLGSGQSHFQERSLNINHSLQQNLDCNSEPHVAPPDPRRRPTPQLPPDEGLLGDMVPAVMWNK